MLDVIARLLLSAGIMVGTTYLPMLSQAVGARPVPAPSTAAAPSACPSGRSDARPAARPMACPA